MCGRFTQKLTWRQIHDLLRGTTWEGGHLALPRGLEALVPSGFPERQRSGARCENS